MVWSSDLHRSAEGDSGRQVNHREHADIFTIPPPAEDPRPFWQRLLSSLRVDIDLKAMRFWIKGEASW